MKLYEDFEKAYKLIAESQQFEDVKETDCHPEELKEDKVLDKMISFYQKSEEYEKCSLLLKIKCWRERQDKKYDL